MTPADRRVAELVDKWLTSIDLHLKYVELNDAAYARAQTWPKHDRPTRWILEIARQKVLELKGQCETREAMGDSKFSESLELMAFLANLVGIQHIQRFIPLAETERADTGSTVTMETRTAQQARPARAAGDDTTREMPKLKAANKSAAAAPVRAKAAEEKPRPAPAPAKAAPQPKPVATTADVKNKIIADAIRLMKWGKPWHELAELIERIAERPPAAEIRKVLRAHKSEIEAKAGANG
jgi:hypothetical protein